MAKAKSFQFGNSYKFSTDNESKEDHDDRRTEVFKRMYLNKDKDSRASAVEEFSKPAGLSPRRNGRSPTFRRALLSDDNEGNITKPSIRRTLSLETRGNENTGPTEPFTFQSLLKPSNDTTTPATTEASVISLVVPSAKVSKSSEMPALKIKRTQELISTNGKEEIKEKEKKEKGKEKEQEKEEENEKEQEKEKKTKSEEDDSEESSEESSWEYTDGSTETEEGSSEYTEGSTDSEEESSENEESDKEENTSTVVGAQKFGPDSSSITQQKKPKIKVKKNPNNPLLNRMRQKTEDEKIEKYDGEKSSVKDWLREEFERKRKEKLKDRRSLRSHLSYADVNSSAATSGTNRLSANVTSNLRTLKRTGTLIITDEAKELKKKEAFILQKKKNKLLHDLNGIRKTDSGKILGQQTIDGRFELLNSIRQFNKSGLFAIVNKDIRSDAINCYKRLNETPELTKKIIDKEIQKEQEQEVKHYTLEEINTINIEGAGVGFEQPASIKRQVQLVNQRRRQDVNKKEEGEEMSDPQEDVYVCRKCGNPIFLGRNVEKPICLWGLGDYKVNCFLVKEIINLNGLRRYDLSLHHGWYCSCYSFIAMKMIVDKYGCGCDHYIIYQDDVILKEKYGMESSRSKYKVPSIGQSNYDLIAGPEVHDQLVCVLFSAKWAPPCRWMSHLFSEIIESEELKNHLRGEDRFKVRCYEVDIDIEVEFFEEYNNKGVPFVVFYFNGTQVVFKKAAADDSSDWATITPRHKNNLWCASTKKKYHIIDGGIMGALDEKLWTAL
eukprot:CAMPEP_0174266932 /NCGR_PEP_ID=MMETSP0439-20130205/31910_1 /TAXON_ID=0 /ORGANISM="Stereomyxa ramosa, Strain Chinc5" /LENGTH=779 /DNA_ID=CAMNT_0015354187 /DNA_START=16 /DNA_END=2356 /DNA_ORIENTATION=+